MDNMRAASDLKSNLKTHQRPYQVVVVELEVWVVVRVVAEVHRVALVHLRVQVALHVGKALAVQFPCARINPVCRTT